MALKTATLASPIPSVARAYSARVAGRARLASFDFVMALALAVFGLALSLTHPWSHATVGHAQYGDAAYWDLAGESWARGYISTKIPDIRPGYSVFLGTVYSLFGADFKYGFVAQALLYAAGCCMVYLIGKRVAGRLGGVLAGALFVLDPFMWQWTATSTTELVGSIVNLCAVYCLVQVFCGRHRYLNAGLCGLSLAAANSVRPLTMGFIAPAVLLVLFAARGGWRTRAGLAATALAIFVVGLLPATYYQFRSTGQTSLSSNGWANLYAASSPKYKTWVPAIYDDVNNELKVRELPETPENADRVFKDMTIQNYLKYPAFQISRLAIGFVKFGWFDGQLEWADQYGRFYRPIVALSGIALGVLVFRGSAERSRLRLLFGVTLAVVAVATFVDARVFGLTLGIVQTLAICLAAAVFVRQTRANAALAVVALFWLSTGFLAIVSTGVEGFFMNRLYTQVEPARAVLLAVGLAWLISGLVTTRLRRPRGLQLLRIKRLMPDLSGPRHYAPALLGLGAAALALAGLARLALTNWDPAPTRVSYVAPRETQLAAMAQQLHLPGTIEYVTPERFAVVHKQLVSGDPPPSNMAYAFPGEFTRFLWDLPDQDRTAFWYVFARGPHPAALDQTLLTADVASVLAGRDYANRQGLLIVSPTGAYWDNTGEVHLQNLLTARAFIPVKPNSPQFRLDEPIVFPLETELYNEQRLKAAQTTGKVEPSSLERVAIGDRNLPALRFTLTPAESQTVDPVAQITFPDVFVPFGAKFEAWTAVHPRFYLHPQLGQLRVEVGVRVDGRDEVVGQQFLSSMDQPLYRPFEADLSRFAGQHAAMFIRASQAAQAREQAIVLVGDPRVVMPR